MRVRVCMKSLLLVDDDAVICVELRRTLELFGYKVEIAHSFESALHRYSNATIRCDPRRIQPPIGALAHPRAGKGINLVRQMRALNVAVPILVFTAMEGELYETASFDAGADDLITKTEGFPSFLSRLRAHAPRNERFTSTHSEE
jgi:DNA-binding response OmpR family regulator